MKTSLDKFQSRNPPRIPKIVDKIGLGDDLKWKRDNLKEAGYFFLIIGACDEREKENLEKKLNCI